MSRVMALPRARSAFYNGLRCAVGSVALLSFAYPTQALAQGDSAKAQAIYEEARALHENADFAGAEAKYQQSWDLYQDFKTAANLGECELEISQGLEALEHLTYAAERIPKDISEEQRTRIQALVERARAGLGTLQISVSPEGAAVEVVDGGGKKRKLGTAPIAGPVYVEPGAWTVSASLARHQASTEGGNVIAGQSADVTIILKPTEAEDGPLVEPLSEQWRRSPVPPIITGTLAAGGLALGVVGFVVAAGKSSDRDALVADLPTNACSGTPEDAELCAEAQDLSDGSSTFQTVGLLGLIGGGVFTVVTVAYLVWPEPAPWDVRIESARVVPIVGPDEAGVGVIGRF